MPMAKQAGAVSPGWLPGCGLPDQEWKLPLALAIAVHVVVLGLGLASPVLFDRQPTLPEIQTVDLVNAVEPGPSHVRRMAPVVIKPAHKIKAVAKKAPPAMKPPPAKARAVSERPLPSRTAKDLAKLRKIRLSLAAQQAREAEQLAKEKVNDAVANIRDLLHEENTAASVPAAPQPMPAAKPVGSAAQTAAPGVPADGSSGAVAQKALRRYLAAVHDRIHQHWSLPDLQSWDDSLETVVVIKVRKDGTIIDSFFEKRSNNIYFNQYVQETIREANPLPPFPPDLKKEQLEIGLRFRPGEIL